MRIVILGGGPAGLYASILLKKTDPTRDITIYERNRVDASNGWGIVFSAATLDNLAVTDAESYAAISNNFHHWDDCTVLFKGRSTRSTGHRFCGIDRKKLLTLLQARASKLGVKIEFGRHITDISLLGNPDLIVAADGVNSVLRNQYAEHFQPNIELGKCRYLWLGTRLKLDAFTFISEHSEWGWFQAHAYQFDNELSSFIVECHEETWIAAGLDQLDEHATLRFCERIFGKHLRGQALIAHKDAKDTGHTGNWLNFKRVTCQHWYHENIVLIGDSAHTAHFSIGSGTKLAMEDAISLSQALHAHPDNLHAALSQYQQERSLEAIKLQNAARNRMEWFENVARYSHLEPEQFSYSLLTGSQRIGHENLRQRDPEYVTNLETWLAEQNGVDCSTGSAPPPMFTPFNIAGLTLKNRIVVSPMAMYSCDNGLPGDFHLVHLGSRALGGAGLIMTEMTAITPAARITPGCSGIWSDEQMHAWRRIVAFIHQQSDTKVGLQIGHAGPKGSTQLGWQAIDEPLIKNNWPLIAASAVAYSEQNQCPAAMTHADMATVTEDFIVATQRALHADFDLLELHCAHGYLLSSFLCPLTNQRDDEYGGTLINRLRFPLEICRAVRNAWPLGRPLSVRISAHDWTPGGNTPTDAVIMAQHFKEAGADLIDVSSGQTIHDAQPLYGRMYQTPFADQIRNEVGIATIAVGNIYDPDHVNSIISAGRADLCALARPHLANPAWTLHAAATLGFKDAAWPRQYLSGKEQLERNLTTSQNNQQNLKPLF